VSPDPRGDSSDRSGSGVGPASSDQRGSRDQPGLRMHARLSRLVMHAVACDPDVVRPWMPPGVSPDVREGRALPTVVALTYSRLRAVALPLPVPSPLFGLNLRVPATRGRHRGLAFVEVLVSNRLAGFAARHLGGGPIGALSLGALPPAGRGPTSSRRRPAGSGTGTQSETVGYQWRTEGGRGAIVACSRGEPAVPAPGSLEEFLVARSRGWVEEAGSCLETVLEHPPWRVRAAETRLEGDLDATWSPAVARVLRGAPVSGLLVEGSESWLRRPVRVAEDCREVEGA